MSLFAAHPNRSEDSEDARPSPAVLMVVIPIVLVFLHAILYPSDDVVGTFDDPVVSLIPGAHPPPEPAAHHSQSQTQSSQQRAQPAGAARVKRAIEKKGRESKRVAPSPESAWAATSQTQDAKAPAAAGAPAAGAHTE